MRRILVAGGEHVDQWATVQIAMDAMHASSPIGQVLCAGLAGGLAARWAMLRGVPSVRWTGSWLRQRPDLVVVFVGECRSLVAEAEAIDMQVISIGHQRV